MESRTATFKELSFPVQGMSCGSCVRQIKTALEDNSGVKTVEVNLAAGEKRYRNPQTTSPVVIAEAIRKSGYKPGAPRAEQMVNIRKTITMQPTTENAAATIPVSA